jgi:hypothetical protein
MLALHPSIAVGDGITTAIAGSPGHTADLYKVTSRVGITSNGMVFTLT